MKKLFLATTAFVVLTAASAGAADMTARPAYAAPPPAPVYTWSGMYFGANVGYSWGQSKTDGTPPGVAVTTNETQNIDGVIGGGQTGYNYQFGSWVWGFESDLQASGQKGGSTIPVFLGTTVTTDHKLEWFGTSRSRLGFLATPNLLLYGTGGVAYGQIKDTYTVTAFGFPAAAAVATVKDVRAGWTLGGGIEGAFGGGWSAKVEYLYIDLGKLEQTVALPLAGIPAATFNTRLTDNIVRVGLNYKWGGYGY